MKKLTTENNYSHPVYDPEYYNPVIFLPKLKESFLTRFNSSLDQEALIKIEINWCNMVFDNNLLPISSSNMGDKYPLDDSHIIMTNKQIFLTRKAYNEFIIEGKEISTYAPGWLSWWKNVLPWTLDDLQGHLNFAKCLKEYQRFLNDLLKKKIKPFISDKLLTEIYNYYVVYFKSEPREKWIERFSYPHYSIEPFELSNSYKEDSDKLVLLAILSFVQEQRKHKFDFQKFVKDRFGISSFYTEKSRRSNTVTFKKVINKCKEIKILLSTNM